VARVARWGPREPPPAAERARAKIDLIVTSVLLDAGGRETWRFREEQTGQTFARSRASPWRAFGCSSRALLEAIRRAPGD